MTDLYTPLTGRATKVAITMKSPEVSGRAGRLSTKTFPQVLTFTLLMDKPHDSTGRSALAIRAVANHFEFVPSQLEGEFLEVYGRINQVTSVLAARAIVVGGTGQLVHGRIPTPPKPPFWRRWFASSSSC